MKTLFSFSPITRLPLSRAGRRRFIASLPWLTGGFLLHVTARAGTTGTGCRQPEIEALPVGLPWLEPWSSAARMPVHQTSHPVGRRLLQAMEAGGFMTVRYFGGTHPGQTRRIQPAQLFTVEGYGDLYLMAFDLDKQQHRTFRLSRMEAAE